MEKFQTFGETIGLNLKLKIEQYKYGIYFDAAYSFLFRHVYKWIDR